MMGQGGNNRQGFTLVELLMAIAIFGIVTSVVYNVFIQQQKSYRIQEQVADMQQNLRAGLDLMSREIRMAGYDVNETGNYNIITAAMNGCEFDADLNEDGGAPAGGAGLEEEFHYELFDSDGDGVGDAVRRTPGGSEGVAYNIDALGFAYAYDADDNGALEVSPNGNVIWGVDTGAGSWYRLDTNDDGVIDDLDAPTPGVAVTEELAGVGTGVAVDLSTIRGVRVWMLARTRRGDPGFSNNRTYIVGPYKVAVNDNFRRKLLTTIIKCRNMGL